MSEPVTIPSLGFVRGAVVRRHGKGANMLVVRGLGATTAVIVIESDDPGNVRLREVPTNELQQVLPSDLAADSIPGGSHG